MPEQQKISSDELKRDIEARGLKFSISTMTVAVAVAVEEAESTPGELTPDKLRPLIHAQYERLLREKEKEEEGK